MKTCVPTVLANWFAKLNAAVRWNNTLSSQFHVNAGVRQGSELSPRLFNVFINIIIVKLRETQCACHINRQFLGCILYANDIIM